MIAKITTTSIIHYFHSVYHHIELTVRYLIHLKKVRYINSVISNFNKLIVSIKMVK